MRKRKVEFVFGQDDMTGEFGCLPKNYVSSEFNYFWTHQGLFHDIFEHHTELTHKYFRGKYAFNVGGELFAMGVCYSLYDNFCMQERLFGQYHAFHDSIFRGCEGLLDDIKEDCSSFGDVVLCNVPYQRPTESSYFEDRIVSLTEKYPTYKKEVTRLMRAGFHYAERRYKRTWEAEQNIYNLFQTLIRLTKNSIEELMYEYSGFTIWTNNKFEHKLKFIKHETK